METTQSIEYAALTQSVEYLLGKEEVGGSSPLGSSIKSHEFQRFVAFIMLKFSDFTVPTIVGMKGQAPKGFSGAFYRSVLSFFGVVRFGFSRGTSA